MIDLQSAAHLLDFAKRIGPGQRAQEQLEGAVAIHNILARHGVAYLADEVGMGKTYVALGALALFRHADPGFRVLVIAPRENIQQKWMKELRNFVAHNYRVSDLRVKGLDNRPVRRMVSCRNLMELVREATMDPDRDFFVRMTSFSLSVGGKGKDGVDVDEARRMRNELRGHLPWIGDGMFDLRSKQSFKENFANAVCCALPEFDLVIVDEAHNLKHGYSRTGSARNHVLAHALGRDPACVDRKLFSRYGFRAKRVLLLSATPVEETYRHLWNQLDMFGFGERFKDLRRTDLTDEEMKLAAAKVLIRRVTSIRVGKEELTKNLYRREWREGGLTVHDEPIAVKDPRQRLTVALVQKKVSELLGHQRFNSSFQIGMLASFESFLETTKVKAAEEDTTFDDVEQTEEAIEREGIDVNDVNRLASSYRKAFDTELPHPKMDALVNALGRAWCTGEKALIFVRRVASVKEIKRKLDERYDAWLLGRLRTELPESVRPRFERIIERYRAEKQEALSRNQDIQAVSPAQDADRGGKDTFFAWFFRGEGPARIISGANIQRRFTQRGTTLSTFFEDNYAAWVLGSRPSEVEPVLASALKLDPAALRAELRERSRKFLPRVKKLARGDLYEAVQAAAIEALSQQVGPHQALAHLVFEERFRSCIAAAPAVQAPDIGNWLEHRTFFTEIRKRSALRNALWPEATSSDLLQDFKEQELRRQLLGAAARLGHGLIDLYVLAIRRLGTLELRAQETSESETEDMDLGRINEYLDLLEHQRSTPRTERPWCGFDELADLAANLELILDVNLPGIRDIPSSELTPLFGRLLREQQPTGGMAGQINQTLVRQFRLPGYPLVLVTTELLQEGEDLHTFCSSIHHYGISWTPSAMEQRIGRIDRVRSHTDRRLGRLQASPSGEQKLQVYFPYLRDTVEVLQVRRVLDRMDVFLRLMHEGLTHPVSEESRIDTTREFAKTYRPATNDKRPLKSSFPITPELLKGKDKDVPAVAKNMRALVHRFARLRELPVPGVPIEWEPASSPGTLMGTARLATRQQPLAISLDMYKGRPRLRCVSPVGRVYPAPNQSRLIQTAWRLGARIGAVKTDDSGTYDLTVEEDVLLTDESRHDAQRLQALITRVADEADMIEQEYLPGVDESLSTFRADLERESANGR
ncbi:MAG: DEAD/DEAH box helicase family protein [Pseudomonadota bacterium]